MDDSNAPSPATPTPSPLPPKQAKLRPKWSSVWMHCTDLKNGKALCNICNSELSYHSHLSSSTYNLKRHLRLKHPTLGLSRKKRLAMGKTVSKPERRSTVWDHCTVIAEHKVRCELCLTELVYHNASTHNLKRHLETKHTPEELQNNSKSASTDATSAEQTVSKRHTKQVLSSAVEVGLASEESTVTVATTMTWSDTDDVDDDTLLDISNRKTCLSGTKRRLYDEALIEMIALDFQPTSIVDDVGFRDLVQQLQPSYTLPRQRTLHDKMMRQRYSRLLTRRRHEMQQEATAVCLTIEGWTSNSDHRYFSVTGHYLSAQLENRTCLLDCCEYRHQTDTITNLKDELVRITEDWHIQDKIVAVVTDNISEILTAVELIGWTRLPCFTYTLNAIASDALAEIDEMLIKIRTIVEHFRCSTAASTMLRSVMQHMSINEMDLVQDISPHWTSTYHMMHRFNELRDAIINTLSLLNEPCLQLLSWPDWDIIGRSCDLMMSLYEAAIEISSEKYMAASKAVVMVRGLLRLCQEHIGTPGQLPTIEKMASGMISSITNWFGNMELNPLLAEAMLLDPRFKKSGFMEASAAELAVCNVLEAASCTVTEQTVPEAVDPKPHVSSVWDDYDQQVSDMVSSVPTKSAVSVSVSRVSTDMQRSSSVWADYDEKTSSASASCNNNAVAKQLDRFLAEPLLSRQGNSLEWWRQRTSVYPCLMSVVRERLCVVATSVSSENIFTTNGLALNERRRALGPAQVRVHIFLNSNIQTAPSTL